MTGKETVKENKKRGLFGRIMEKLGKILEQQARKSSCCGGGADKGKGSSCC